VSPPERDATPVWATGADIRNITTAYNNGTTQGSSTAEREAALRVHAVAVVLDAVDAGIWQLEVGIVDGAVALLEAASRWALVAELETVA
jgi:hypothetical protein